MKITCRVCKNSNTSQKCSLEKIKSHFFSVKDWEDISYQDNTKNAHEIRAKIVESERIFKWKEVAFTTQNLQNFSSSFFKNEIDTSMKTYLEILDLAEHFYYTEEGIYHPQDILHAVAIYVLVSKHESRVTEEDLLKLRENFGIDLTKFCEIYCKILQNPFYNQPSSRFFVFTHYVCQMYFKYLILVRTKKKGVPSSKLNDTQCSFKMTLNLIALRFYAFLIETSFKFRQVGLLNNYFMVVITVLDYLAVLKDNDKHFNSTLIMIMMEEMGIEYIHDYRELSQAFEEFLIKIDYK